MKSRGRFSHVCVLCLRCQRAMEPRNSSVGRERFLEAIYGQTSQNMVCTIINLNSFLRQGALGRGTWHTPVRGRSCLNLFEIFPASKVFCKWRRAREANAREVCRRTLQRFLSLERVILAEAIWRRIKPLPLYTLSDSSLVVPQMLTFAQQGEVVNDWCLQNCTDAL